MTPPNATIYAVVYKKATATVCRIVCPHGDGQIGGRGFLMDDEAMVLVGVANYQNNLATVLSGLGLVGT